MTPQQSPRLCPCKQFVTLSAVHYIGPPRSARHKCPVSRPIYHYIPQRYSTLVPRSPHLQTACVCYTRAAHSHTMHSDCHAHASQTRCLTLGTRSCLAGWRRRWSCAQGAVDERSDGSCAMLSPCGHGAVRAIVITRAQRDAAAAPNGGRAASLAVFGSSFYDGGRCLAPPPGRGGHGGRPRANLENPTRSFTKLNLAVTVHSVWPGATPTGFA